MMYACRMYMRTNPDKTSIKFGNKGRMELHSNVNAEIWASEVSPATYAEIGAEIERLEESLKWAEIQLANCSWETGDSNRAKVLGIKAQLIPLVSELQEAGNEL